MCSITCITRELHYKNSGGCCEVPNLQRGVPVAGCSFLTRVSVGWVRLFMVLFTRNRWHTVLPLSGTLRQAGRQPRRTIMLPRETPPVSFLVASVLRCRLTGTLSIESDSRRSPMLPAGVIPNRSTIQTHSPRHCTRLSAYSTGSLRCLQHDYLWHWKRRLNGTRQHPPTSAGPRPAHLRQFHSVYRS